MPSTDAVGTVRATRRVPSPSPSPERSVQLCPLSPSATAVAAAAVSFSLEPATIASAPNIQGGPEKLAPFSYALTLANINRFSKLFHYQNQKKICNNAIAKDPTVPQVCRYTTFKMSSVLKATIFVRLNFILYYSACA